MELYTDGTIEGTPQEIAEYKGLSTHSIAIKGVDFKIKNDASFERVVKAIVQDLEEKRSLETNRPVIYI